MSGNSIAAMGGRRPVQTLGAAALITILWLLPCLASANSVIVASATDQSRVAAVAEIILKRVYRTLGYELKTLYLPGKRALHKSNLGEVDVELVRIEAVGREYPGLIQVPESLFDIRGVAFTRDANMTFQGEQSFWGRRVGIVRGIRWAEKAAEGHSPTVASNVHELFKLLAHGRIDIALEAQLTGMPELENFPGRGIAMLIEPVVLTPVYHFVNSKHRDLVKPLAEEIGKMKKTGETHRILSTYYKNAAPDHN